MENYGVIYNKSSARCGIMDVRNLANNILRRSFKQENPITNMKLLKLLYFIYGEYLKNHSKRLFTERFEAWDYGPVLPTVYNEFKGYGAGKIEDYYRDTSGNAFDITETPDIKSAIDKIWIKYYNSNGIELSKITHQNGSAWRKAWENNYLFLEDEDIKNEP